MTSQVALVVKNLPANARDTEDAVLIPGSGRSSGGGGNSNSLPYSCLRNPMDRRTWQATVHGVPKSRTQLSITTTTIHYYIAAIKGFDL